MKIKSDEKEWVKLSKSDQKDPSIDIIPDHVKIEALKSEVDYWKLKYKLLKRFGNTKT